MLIFYIAAVVSAILFLSACLTLHFRQHFRFQSCFKPKRSRSGSHGVMPILRRTFTPTLDIHHTRSRCQSLIVPVDDEEFDFFPVSFVSYLIFLVFVCALILYQAFHSPYSELVHLRYMFNDVTRNFTGWSAFWSVNSMHHYDTRYQSGNNALDWILMYAVVMLSMWDSLFSFYRYFTTLYSSTKFETLSLSGVVRYYCVYAMPFLALYLCQIHVYYLLFPVLIVAHLSLNCWCNWKFASILIDTTIRYAQNCTIVKYDIHNEMLRSIYFMRRTSLLWSLVSTLQLSLFVAIYNVQIVYFLPLLWCISCLCFTLNFVRNRSKLYRQTYKLYQACKRCCLCCVQHRHLAAPKPITTNISPLTRPVPTNIALAETQPKPKPKPIPKSTVEQKRVSYHSNNKQTRNSLADLEDGGGGVGTFSEPLADLEVVVDDENEIVYTGYLDPVFSDIRKQHVQQQQQLVDRVPFKRRRTQLLRPHAAVISKMTSVSEPLFSEHTENGAAPATFDELVHDINTENKLKHRTMPTPSERALAELLSASDQSHRSHTNEAEVSGLPPGSERNDSSGTNPDGDHSSSDDNCKLQLPIAVSIDVDRSKQRKNKALELLGFTPTPVQQPNTNASPNAAGKVDASPHARVPSISHHRSNSLQDFHPQPPVLTKLHLLPSQSARTTMVQQHQRQPVNGAAGAGLTFDVDEDIDRVIELTMDSPMEESRSARFAQHPGMNAFTMEVTNKLQSFQRESIYDPTIVRRLEYANRFGVGTSVAADHDPSALGHHRRSLSAPTSPRVLKHILDRKQRRSSKPKIFGDDTDVAYDYSDMNNSHASNDHNIQTRHRKASSANQTPLAHNENDARSVMAMANDFMAERKRGGGHAVKSTEADRSQKDLEKRMHLMVVQGFYSRHGFNSIQQLHQFKSGNKTLSAIREEAPL
mmetsp:Transcript_56027/g.93368  ORF Transcript_56027/g.93368 Transcript_56027/m.93368 type:complete len:926 (-) Transcript_56027:42-2819(-)